MLDHVFASGLFLNATDRERSCYSYHKLFREMVLGRLMDRAPARASELHRRASTFLAKSGQPLDALEHAQLSCDENFLADQLDTLSADLVYTGYSYRIDTLDADLPWQTRAHRNQIKF